MKFWSCVVIFFAAIVYFAPDKENALAARITKNLSSMKYEKVYASSNSAFTQNPINIKLDDKYYLRKLIQFHSSIPKDCVQSRNLIMDFYKESIEKDRKVTLKDFLENFNATKKYCSDIVDVSEKYYLE